MRAHHSLVFAAVLAGATVSASAGEREDALLVAVRKGDAGFTPAARKPG